MQAKDIQQTLEANGVPTNKAMPAAKILAKELRNTNLVRSPQEQTIITAAWESLSKEPVSK
jgi:hypothetical protein